MKHVRRLLWVLVIAGMLAAVGACKEKLKGWQGPPAAEEPPLLLEDNPGGEELPPPEGPVADNSRCHVCHMNYEDEELAVLHARANVGCEQCHGASDAHCSDEDNVTPPDVMYPLEKIKPSCMMCHPREKIDIQPHEPLFDGTAAEKKYCTDCHGNHRLGYRTRRWDKTTGELIEDDNVRMTTGETP